MGNTAFDSLVTSTVSSIGQDIPWSKQFSMLDKQPLNNTYILHHIPTNNSYKVKHMTLNKTQHQEIFRQIDIKKNTPSPFVTKLEKTQQYTVKGYCSQHQQVFLMYKYVQTNLKEEILNRRFRQEKFLQQEIQVIMESGVKGISYLHEIGCTPKGLNTSQILLTQQRAVLINDPWLSVGSPLAHTGQGSNNKQSSNEQTNGSKILSIPVQDYPSPQKILYMNELIEQYNEWLSQLFTFGMIVLETIFMTSLNEQLYDKSQKKIYYHKVKEKVQQIVQGQQMDKSNNGGGESLLSEIKQDLRRLLSHQPKIRESVYLKYKKSHGSYLFLKKPKDEFKLNQLQRKEGMNRVQNQKPNIQSNEMRQLIKNVNVYDTIDKKLNIQQLSKKYSKQGDNNLSKILRQGEKSNNNNKFSKQNWVLNSINEQYMNMSKEKQTNNRFRVVSSSLPHGSKFNTNTHANNNNYFQVSKLNTIGDINNNNINNNINNTLGYRQLGGAPSSSINREYSQYRPNSFLSKFNTNTSINNPINNYTNVCSNNNYTKIEQLNNNNNISNNNNNNISNNNNNNISNNNNNNISNNNNNNISNKPSELFTGQSNNYLTKIYSNINHTNHQDTNNNNIVRRGQLSPKKQSLVQKQSEILKYPYSSYKNRTTSTIPSSPYLSTISTNAYQSQISPLFGQQYNKSQYDNFSQLKVMNMNENNYNNNSSLNNNNNKNVNNNQINLPLNMVTRSSSSYVLQNGKVGGQNNISNSNYNNNSNSNNNSNYQYSYKLAQTNTNTNWTYQSMIKNNNNQRNALGNNEQRVSQFKQKVQEKNPYPSKISLSQFYLNKYNNPNQQTNQTHVNNNNNLNINTQVDFTTKRSQYYSINNNPTTDQYINPTHNYNNNTTYNPSSYEAFKQNFSNYSSPNYYNIPNNNTNLYNNNTSNTYQQQIQPSKTSSIINQQNPSYHKLPSSKELSNFNFREVGSLYCDQSHFLNDKESIVIQSYNTGGFNNKYQSNNRSQLPVNTFSNNNSNFPTFNNINNTFNNNSNIPTTSPKSSFQINHSMINNTRNQGKSFSSMDQDLKQLRKFAQKQPVQKKPNSSYSSSQKVSLIDKIYDPQVMASFDRRSFQNKQDYFGTSYTQQQQQGTINNRSSQDINNHRTTEKPLHSRNNSSQNYLQTPQRYPNKYKLNSTIRQASCEDSGVNQSHNNSNREDSYQHQKVYPNTQISKYQLMNDQRRFSQRKVEDNQHRQDLMQRPIQIDRQGKKQTNFNIQNNSNANAPTFKNIEQTHQNAHENNPNQQKVTLYADGSRFIGSTDQNGQSHGFGTLYYPDGHVAYEGQWQHGDFNGKGILFNPYELKMEKSYDYRDLTKMDEYIKQFEGIFNHDVKSGKGVLKMHNNEVFEGEFSNDLPNGKGKFYCSDGNIVEGVWQRGYLQQTY